MDRTTPTRTPRWAVTTVPRGSDYGLVFGRVPRLYTFHHYHGLTDRRVVIPHLDELRFHRLVWTLLPATPLHRTYWTGRYSVWTLPGYHRQRWGTYLPTHRRLLIQERAERAVSCQVGWTTPPLLHALRSSHAFGRLLMEHWAGSWLPTGQHSVERACWR